MNHELGNVRLVIIFLGVATLLCVGGGLWLASDGIEIPEFVVAVGGGAIGALSGILSKTSTGPQEVKVVESEHDPVVVQPEV